MTKGKTVGFRRLPSMMAWLNDYKPKRGRFLRVLRTGIHAASKPRKGLYKRQH